MKGDKSQMRPIMANGDDMRGQEFGANGYTKPSAALTLLRETVMGPGAVRLSVQRIFCALGI